jgi:hypothetical protein
MKELICVMIGVSLAACGVDQESSRTAESGVFNNGGPTSEALGQQGAVASQWSGLQADPCLGDSSDGLCFGIADTQCVASQTLVAECSLLCDGICVDLPSTKIPSCQCPSELSACGGLNGGGECRGDVLLVCKEGSLSAVDCAFHGSSCVENVEGAGCGAVGNYENCGALVSGPTCQGNTWMRCQSGAVVAVDCAEMNLLCGWDPAEEAYGCYK